MPSIKRQCFKSNSSKPEKPPEKVKKVATRRKDTSKSRKVLFTGPSTQNEPDVLVSMYTVLLSFFVFYVMIIVNFCYADKYGKSITMVGI